MLPEEDYQLTSDRIAEKLDFLRRAWEREPDRFETAIAVGPPLTDADIHRVEVEHRLTLPSEYREFRRRFGDTATGPGNVFYRLRDGLKANSDRPFPLHSPFMGESAPARQQLTKEQQRADELRLRREWDAIPKDHGVIGLCGYGCAIDAFLIVNGPYSGRVWIQQGDTSYYGPYGGYELFDGAAEFSTPVYPPVYPAEDYSFCRWYEYWLDLQVKRVRWWSGTA